jgi:hypothetical protein
LIAVIIFAAFLFLSAQAQPYYCTFNNPCDQTGNFGVNRGYRCVQTTPGNVWCTCPGGGYETNRPCRICNRVDSKNNACNSPKLITCLEGPTYGTGFACLCQDSQSNTYLTTSGDCDGTVKLTTPPTTTRVTPSPCFNGGVFANGICNCPSGYGTQYCAQKYDANTCERINCKNNGVCAIKNPNGPYEGVCLCRYGTSGEYCHITGTLGSCSASSCSNGGSCIANTIGTTTFAYCQCPAGYNGVKCENRYFTCRSAGKFSDVEMFNQGKYFECITVSGSLQAQQRSCPKGLRFNQGLNACTY